MRLIPPDCSHEEAVVQLAHSLSAFQQAADQIFEKAARRTEKCRQRMEQFGKRMEVLERKMEAAEKLIDVPVLNCASHYPELGTAGFFEPVFTSLVPSAPFTRHRDNDFHLSANEPIFTKPSANWLNDAIARRKNLSPHSFGRDRHRKEKVLLDVAKIERLNQTAETNSVTEFADFGQILARLMPCQRGDTVSTSSKQPKSPQIDFSESLLDLTTNGRRPMPSIIGMDSEDDDPFAYEPAELDELVDFDLPEDLPGMDVRSVSLVSKGPTENIFSPIERSSSDRFSSNRTDTSAETAKYVQPPARGGEQTDVPSSKPAENVLLQTPSQRMDSNEMPKQITAPPPPPPPPPPPLSIQQKVASDVPSPMSDDRSGLMAAIRAAGGLKGAKLKKLEVDETDRDERGGNAAGTAGRGSGREEPEDLMSSLTKALEMRRKGMFGRGPTATKGTEKRKQPRSGGGGDTLAVLRERIPRARTDSEETGDEEEEEAMNEWID